MRHFPIALLALIAALFASCSSNDCKIQGTIEGGNDGDTLLLITDQENGIPFDTIKVDRSFVMAIEQSSLDRQLIRNIAELATIFGSKVCVEGIETKGMRDILRGYHVKSFQGYYYARPLLLDQILTWDAASRESK